MEEAENIINEFLDKSGNSFKAPIFDSDFMSLSPYWDILSQLTELIISD